MIVRFLTYQGDGGVGCVEDSHGETQRDLCEGEQDRLGGGGERMRVGGGRGARGEKGGEEGGGGRGRRETIGRVGVHTHSWESRGTHAGLTGCLDAWVPTSNASRAICTAAAKH